MERREALDFLHRVAKGIAEMFGESCETLVQEFQGKSLVTLEIYNGQISGRKAQSTQDILGEDRGGFSVRTESMRTDAINQLVLHPSGKKIKSSSFFLSGKGYEFVLGINFDITLLERMDHLLGGLLEFQGELADTLFENTRTGTLESIYENCLCKMPPEDGKLSREKRWMLLTYLQEQHFFALQKSVPFLAGKLGVSKNTIYKDMQMMDMKRE